MLRACMRKILHLKASSMWGHLNLVSRLYVEDIQPGSLTLKNYLLNSYITLLHTDKYS